MDTIIVKEEHREKIQKYMKEEAHLRESIIELSRAAGVAKDEMWKFIFKHYPESKEIKPKVTLNIESWELSEIR